MSIVATSRELGQGSDMSIAGSSSEVTNLRQIDATAAFGSGRL
jgi:hypothetical protein